MEGTTTPYVPSGLAPLNPPPPQYSLGPLETPPSLLYAPGPLESPAPFHILPRTLPILYVPSGLVSLYPLPQPSVLCPEPVKKHPLKR